MHWIDLIGLGSVNANASAGYLNLEVSFREGLRAGSVTCLFVSDVTSPWP